MMEKLIEILTVQHIQGILGVLTLISGAVFLYLNKKMGKYDERIQYLNIRGTNVVLWTFFICMLILFLANPASAASNHSFILSSFFVSIIIGCIFSVYQYLKY